MRLRQPIRDLVLVLWECEGERVREALPDGFEPIVADGRALVAVAGFRNRFARLGVLPVPPYTELDLRTFVVDREGTTAVFVLAFFVPLVGLAAAPFGVPVQVARIRVAPGRVDAPGVGVSVRYVVGSPAELGAREAALATHPAAYWVKRGRLHRMAGGYHGVTWREAALEPAGRFAPAARLGLDERRPDFALYAERAELRASLPARKA